MSTRYVIENVAGRTELRRIKDTKRSRYVKQPHGAELWPIEAAQVIVAALNSVAKTNP